jgi:cytoskeletal protein CcmA (bactofilin family)
MSEGSVIGRGTVVRGNVRGDGPLEIFGRVEGDVTITGDVLLGEAAAVRGSVTGAQITVSGRVLGDLSGSESVLLEASARVAGDIVAPRIGIGSGALVRGNLRTEGEPSLPVQRKPAFGTVHRLPQRPPARPAEIRGAESRSVESKTSDGRAVEARSSEMRGNDARAAEARSVEPRGPESRLPEARVVEARAEPAGTASSSEPQVVEVRSSEPKRLEATSGEPLESRLRQPPPPLVPTLPKGAQAKKKKSRKT